MRAETTDPVAQLRQLSHDELAQVGEDSLRTRLVEQATFAHQKHGPLTAGKLERFLADPDCVRYPVRLVFEFGEMALHQFAQPDLDYRHPDVDGRVLYVRPALRKHPDLLVLAVAYMVPVINYRDLISDEHCVLYGATLLGLMEEEFYQRICALADFAGTEVRYPEAKPAGPVAADRVSAPDFCANNAALSRDAATAIKVRNPAQTYEN